MTVHSIGRLEFAISPAGDALSASCIALLHHFGKAELPRLIQTCLVAERLDRHIVQIDTLHIDLGAIDEADLPQGLVKPFLQQFSKALAGIQTVSGTSEIEDPKSVEDARLHACVTDFLRDGLFRGSFDTPDDALNALIDSKPVDLITLLDEWLADTAIRRRLARQFSRLTQRRILSIVRRRRITGLPLVPPLERGSSERMIDLGLGTAKRNAARDVLDGRTIRAGISPEKSTAQFPIIANGSVEKHVSNDLPSPSGNRTTSVGDDLAPQVDRTDAITIGIHDLKSPNPQRVPYRRRNTTSPDRVSIDPQDVTISPVGRSKPIDHASEREVLAHGISSRRAPADINQLKAIEPMPFPHRDRREVPVAVPDRAPAVSKPRIKEAFGGRLAGSADGVRSILPASHSTASGPSEHSLSHLDDLDFHLRVLCGLTMVRVVDADDTRHIVMTAAIETPKIFVIAIYRFPQKHLLTRALVAHLSCSDLTVLANLMKRVRASHVRPPVVGQHEQPRSNKEWHALFSSLLPYGPSTEMPYGRESRSSHPDEIASNGWIDRYQTEREGAARRRMIHRGPSNNVSILATVMLEMIPVEILKRLLTDHARHGVLLAALLLNATGDPEVAVSTWSAAIEDLMSSAYTRRSRRAFLRDIARRHATLTGTTPAFFLERLRALSIDRPLVETIGFAIAMTNRSKKRPRQSHRRATDINPRSVAAQRASKGAIALIERLAHSLPAPAYNEMIIALAGRHAAIVRDRLEASEAKPHIAGATRQAIAIVATALGPRRQSRRRFMQSVDEQVASMTRKPTSRLSRPGPGTKQDGEHPAGASDDSLDTTMLDEESPTGRRSMIVRQMGRHAPIALAFLDAAGGSLARPTIEAVFLEARSSYRRPRHILVRSIAGTAAQRAGLSLSAYCHAIGARSTDVIFREGLDRVLSENPRLPKRPDIAETLSDRADGQHNDDTHHVVRLPALRDAIRRRPAELVTTLRAYRPRALLVRAMYDHLPHGVLYDLVALMAGRDAALTTALLEAADLVTHLSFATWTATLGLLLARQSDGGFSRPTLGRIVNKSAQLAGLSVEDYLSRLEEQDRTGRITTVAYRIARRSAYADKRKLIRAKASPQKVLGQQSQQAVHLIARALTDASSVIEDTTVTREMFIETWSRTPAAVVAALRTGASRSSAAKAIVRVVPRSIRDEIVAMLAGRHSASVAVLTAKFDDDPTIAIPSWEAALTILLRHEPRRGTRHGLIAAILDHAAYRSWIPIDVYQTRLRSHVRLSRLITDFPVEARSLGVRGEKRTDDAPRTKPPAHPVRQHASWAARDVRLTRTQEVRDLFFHILDHGTTPPWHRVPESTTPGALLSSLLKTATRPIAIALSRRASATGLDPVCLERLTRADARRLLRSLSRRHATLITSLIDAAELSIERRGGEPTLVALDIVLKRTVCAIEPKSFCADFIARLADNSKLVDREIIAYMTSVVTPGSAIDRFLISVASSYTRRKRLEKSRLPPSSFPRKRRLTLEVQYRRLDPLFDRRMIEATDNSDLDRLTTTIANIGRRARRSPRLIGLDQTAEQISFDSATTPCWGSISTNTLLGFLWYGTVPVSVDEALSASMEKRFGGMVPELYGRQYPAGAIGLVSRLRRLEDHSEKLPESQKQDDAISIVISALKSDADVAFRGKAQTLRWLVYEALERSEARARLADAIELGSPKVLWRAALLLSTPPRYRTSARLIAREVASRHACDLFFYILARDALPWWHRAPVPARDIMAAQVRSHRHAIARAFVAQGSAYDDARIMVDRLGITGAMPLIRALAKRHFDLVEATMATSRPLLRDDNARWITALETLLALRGRVEPSSFVAGLAARLADRVGTDAEAIATMLADSSPPHTAVLARSLVEARAGLLLAQGERSGFFGDPVQPPQDEDRVTLMRHYLRYGAPPANIDSAVRDALITDAARAANVIRIAIVHPIARRRIATLPKATLILVLGAVCDGGSRRLRPLLEAMAVNPSSIDVVLAAIGGGQPRIEPLVAIARPTTSLVTPSRPHLVEPGGSIPVDNAGLVILAPFFGRLFSGLGFLDEEKALPMAAAQRAVHVLQYLANAEMDALEHRLVLNKLLCGLDPAIPSIASIVMDDRQTNLADGLLRSVIQNWPPLRSSTIAGLRDTFLQRNGMLRETPDAWVLTVTPGPFDMLLDRLPWPLSVVRLRWMPKLLTVEWR